MAIQWITNLRAQRIARSQTARLYAERFAGFENKVPHLLYGIAAPNNSKPVLPSVSVAGNKNVRATNTKPANLILLQIRHARDAHCDAGRARYALIDKFPDPRTLDGHG